LPLECTNVLWSDFARMLVAPQLAEGFSQPVSRVQPFSGSEQRPPHRLAFQGQVLPAREPRGLLALDGVAVFPAAPAVWVFASLIERLAQVAHEVALVTQDRRLRGMGDGGGAKRLPMSLTASRMRLALFSPSPV
jgi:hypothetical protein